MHVAALDYIHGLLVARSEVKGRHSQVCYNSSSPWGKELVSNLTTQLNDSVHQQVQWEKTVLWLTQELVSTKSISLMTACTTRLQW